jgi:hypothetical protein
MRNQKPCLKLWNLVNTIPLKCDDLTNMRQTFPFQREKHHKLERGRKRRWVPSKENLASQFPLCLWCVDTSLWYDALLPESLWIVMLPFRSLGWWSCSCSSAKQGYSWETLSGTERHTRLFCGEILPSWSQSHLTLPNTATLILISLLKQTWALIYETPLELLIPFLEMSAFSLPVS